MLIRIAVALSLFGIYAGASTIKKHQDEALKPISTCLSIKTAWTNLTADVVAKDMIKDLIMMLRRITQPIVILEYDDLEAMCTTIAGLPYKIKAEIADDFGRQLSKLKRNEQQILTRVESKFHINFSDTLKDLLSVMQGIIDAANSEENYGRNIWKYIVTGFEGSEYDQFKLRRITLMVGLWWNRYGSADYVINVITTLPVEGKAKVAELLKSLKRATEKGDEKSSLSKRSNEELIKIFQEMIDAASVKTYTTASTPINGNGRNTNFLTKRR